MNPTYPPLHVDKISKCNDEMLKNTNPDKINVVIGLYKTNNGEIYKFNCVKTVEEQLINEGLTHNYVPIAGDQKFIDLSTELYFGAPDNVNYKGAQTIGGTGSLDLAAKFIKTVYPNTSIYIPNPTWENHLLIFKRNNLDVHTYEYLTEHSEFNFDKLLDSVNIIPNNNVILLHGCAHNPTGYDLSPNEWVQIIDLCISKNLYVVIDLAYLGLGAGIEHDRFSIMLLNQRCHPSLVCTSYSKNFGLYGERVGCLFVLAKDINETAVAYNIIKSIIRTSYSSPPTFGSRIISTILENVHLKHEWTQELENIHNDFKNIRWKLRNALEKKLMTDFSSITNQTGMFWYARNHLTNEQICVLKKNNIFLLEDGRISVSGLNDSNFERFVDIFVKVKLDN
jgi:aspartate/tyrosine/aromatic aminotransferase